MDLHDEHYLRDVLALGDKRPVVTTIAIYSQSGIKLVNPGTRVNSALYERLVRHKLLPNIEQCVQVENGVDNAQLVQAAKDLLVTNPRFERMTEALPRDALLAAIYHAMLPPPLAFKLTMAREQRPELYAHSVEVALTGAYLRGMSGVQASELAVAATAGLFHDIGLLHIAPEILAPGRRIEDAERRYLYSHPIIGHLIVREYLQSYPAVSTAILEHHERLDGSGYPHGVKAEKISEPGRILMVADAGAALLKSSGRGYGGVALRLLRRKYPPLLLAHLLRLFAPDEEAPHEAADSRRERALQQLKVLAEMLIAWAAAAAELRQNDARSAEDALFNLVDERIVAFERSLLEAGFVAGQHDEYVSAAAQDAEGANEMCELAREAMWQSKDIVLEIRRRLAALAPPEPVQRTISRWLDCADEKLRQGQGIGTDRNIDG